MFRLASVLCLLGCVVPWFARAQPAEIPPPSYIYVRHAEVTFLGLTNVMIARRAHQSVTTMFDIGTATGAAGEPLAFSWWRADPQVFLGDSPRVTNEFALGLHHIDLIVSQGGVAYPVATDFEVMSPLQAVRLLRSDLEWTGLREDIATLRGPLRVAEAAIKRHRWDNASQALKTFQTRLGRTFDADVEREDVLMRRWNNAAEAIRYSVRHLRSGSATPGGVFPGPGSSTGGSTSSGSSSTQVTFNSGHTLWQITTKGDEAEVVAAQ